MNKSFGFVRFSDGEIFIGCYDGGNLSMEKWICTREEMLDRVGIYYPHLYGEQFDRIMKFADIDQLPDVEIVTMATDHKTEEFPHGFYWKGLASKEGRVITKGRNPSLECDFIFSTLPPWATETLQELQLYNRNTLNQHLKRVCRKGEGRI